MREERYSREVTNWPTIYKSLVGQFSSLEYIPFLPHRRPHIRDTCFYDTCPCWAGCGDLPCPLPWTYETSMDTQPPNTDTHTWVCVVLVLGLCERTGRCVCTVWSVQTREGTSVMAPRTHLSVSLSVGPCRCSFTTFPSCRPQRRNLWPACRVVWHNTKGKVTRVFIFSGTWLTVNKRFISQVLQRIRHVYNY